MRRSNWVYSGGRPVPRALFEPLDPNPRPGVCTVCDGAGVTVETIDEERYDVLVPCWKCRTYCRTCKKYVSKNGHECPVKEQR